MDTLFYSNLKDQPIDRGLVLGPQGRDGHPREHNHQQVEDQALR